MPVAAASAETLARIGCNISIDGSQYATITLESLARILTASGRHLTVRQADRLAVSSLETLARIAGPLLTVEI